MDSSDSDDPDKGAGTANAAALVKSILAEDEPDGDEIESKAVHKVAKAKSMYVPASRVVAPPVSVGPVDESRLAKVAVEERKLESVAAAHDQVEGTAGGEDEKKMLAEILKDSYDDEPESEPKPHPQTASTSSPSAKASSRSAPSPKTRDPLDIVDLYERSSSLQASPLARIKVPEAEDGSVCRPLDRSRVEYRFCRKIGADLGLNVENKLAGRPTCIFVQFTPR